MYKANEFKLVFHVILISVLRFIVYLYASFFEKSRKSCLPAIQNEILLMPATEIAAQVRQGKIKSRTVVEAYLKRIGEVNPHINAIVDINKNALNLADEIDKMVSVENSAKRVLEQGSIHEMPLLGVPVSIKDSIAVKGMLITGGLFDRRNTKAETDSDVVVNLRKAGAIPIAITNAPELMMWSHTNSIFVGNTRNPYDLSRSPGGSSGGEGALISSAGSVIGIGSDIGGSLRIPAFRCGIFAHKVTPNVMPRNGIFPVMNDILSPLFTTGPMCRYACDILPTLKAAAGDQIKHLNAIDEGVDLSQLKIFYMFGDGNILRPSLQNDIKDAVLKAVDYFREKYNVACVNVNFEEFANNDEVWTHMFTRGYDYQDGMSNGGPKVNLQEEFIKSIFGYSKHTLHSILFAYLNQYDNNFDNSKLERFQRFMDTFTRLLGTNGVFFYPTMPLVAPKITETLFDFHMIGYTSIFNVIGVPVTQCPLALSSDGLPIGVQVAASPYNDRLSIAVAIELEKVFSGWVSPSKIKQK